MTSINYEKLVEAIHNTPQMIVLEFAGAGAQALAWLHGVGGSSRTILEATDHYAATSLIEAVGFEPKRFTSPQVARAMATNAYIRACHLANAATPVAGIGCTATITTDRPKRGDHRCCVAVCNAQGVAVYSLTLTKGLRTRQEEEHLVSLLILRTIAEVCGLSRHPALPLKGKESVQKEFDSVDLLERLVAQAFDLLTVWPDGQMTPAKRLANVALLSGSFNPLHQGHQQLAQVATKLLNQKVYFELPLINADKDPVDPQEAHQRVAQFADFAPVVLTTAPLFSQKARLFPRSVFVIGVDTAERLTQPRFYNNDPAEMLASFDKIRMAGCRFLVAGRLRDDHFMTLQDLELPAGYRELFEEIPASHFRVDISSTALRQDTSS